MNSNFMVFNESLFHNLTELILNPFACDIIYLLFFCKAVSLFALVYVNEQTGDVHFMNLATEFLQQKVWTYILFNSRITCRSKGATPGGSKWKTASTG